MATTRRGLATSSAYPCSVPAINSRFMTCCMSARGHSKAPSTQKRTLYWQIPLKSSTVRSLSRWGSQHSFLYVHNMYICKHYTCMCKLLKSSTNLPLGSLHAILSVVGMVLHFHHVSHMLVTPPNKISQVEAVTICNVQRIIYLDHPAHSIHPLTIPASALGIRQGSCLTEAGNACRLSWHPWRAAATLLRLLRCATALRKLVLCSCTLATPSCSRYSTVPTMLEYRAECCDCTAPQHCRACRSFIL